MVTIGILALQGAFREHEEMLDKINVGHFLIRKIPPTYTTQWMAL